MKTFSTNLAIGLVTHEHYLPRLTRVDALPSPLESVAAMDYIFSVQNVVVVHHSLYGTTTLTPELMVEEFHDSYHADISTMFDRDSLAIMDFEVSLNHDITLLRSSPAVPKHINLYGFFFEMSSGKLTEGCGIFLHRSGVPAPLGSRSSSRRNPSKSLQSAKVDT